MARCAELAVVSELLTLQGASAVREGRVVLDDVTLGLRLGEMVALVGPNGAGKTTLLRAALGLQPLGGGQARLGGEDVRGLSEAARARKVAYLPQERRLAWGIPAWRAASLGCFDLPPRQARTVAEAALAEVGATHLSERSVFALSGGERARVLLARLLAARAPLMLVDEPVAGLDPDAALLTLDILRERAKSGAGVVCALHDLTLAARTCDRVVVMQAGRIVADAAPGEALTPQTLQNVFGLDGKLVQTAYGPTLNARRWSAPQ